MPNYESIQDEARLMGSSYDILRYKYLNNIYKLTGRNVIAYYCGIAQKSELQKKSAFSRIEFSDGDKKKILQIAQDLDNVNGVDLILHCPDEGMASNLVAVESLIDSLESLFGDNIRTIIPQIVASTGTIIALSCREILMNDFSSIMSIDPKVCGLSANGVLDEVEQAYVETMAAPKMNMLWSHIIGNYRGDFVNKCQDSILASGRLVKNCLIKSMLKGDPKANEKAAKILDDLGDSPIFKSSNRHISLKYAQKLGINVLDLNDMNELQENLFSLHYLYIQTFANTTAFKIVENQKGTLLIEDLE